MIAETAAQGLAQAEALHPDVVLLLDMQLPDRDGLEVLSALRAAARMKGRPTIVVSSSATAREVQAARAAGAHAYWTKPLDFIQTLQGLRAALEQVRPQPAQPVADA